MLVGRRQTLVGTRRSLAGRLQTLAGGLQTRSVGVDNRLVVPFGRSVEGAACAGALRRFQCRVLEDVCRAQTVARRLLVLDDRICVHACSSLNRVGTMRAVACRTLTRARAMLAFPCGSRTRAGTRPKFADARWADLVRARKLGGAMIGLLVRSWNVAGQVHGMARRHHFQ